MNPKTKTTKSTRLMPALVLCLLLCGCSTTRKGGGATNIDHAASYSSSFEITYSLGEHGQHRLTGFSTHSNPELAAYLERSVIDERAIGAESYNEYFAKVVDFTQRALRTPSQDHECRSPYTIVAKIEGKTYSSKGCRSQNDDPSFSKLLREGEFLLYSKK